jgi:hypothetical protein
VRRRAQQRLDEASDIAVVQILNIMRDEKVPANVRLAAARDILDRASVAGAQRVEVSVEKQPWELLMESSIVEVTVDWSDVVPRDARDGREDIVDADMVEDEPLLAVPTRAERLADMDDEEFAHFKELQELEAMTPKQRRARYEAWSLRRSADNLPRHRGKQR